LRLKAAVYVIKRRNSVACYGNAVPPIATDHRSSFTTVAQALGELSALDEFVVLG